MRLRTVNGSRCGSRTRAASTAVDERLARLCREWPPGIECPVRVIAAATGLGRTGVDWILQSARFKIREALVREVDTEEIRAILAR